jgi:hypothetical protein
MNERRGCEHSVSGFRFEELPTLKRGLATLIRFIHTVIHTRESRLLSRNALVGGHVWSYSNANAMKRTNPVTDGSALFLAVFAVRRLPTNN